jgi:hypothetical protein
VWYKKESNQVVNTLVSKYGDSANDRSYLCYVDASDHITFKISSDGTAGNTTTLTGTTALSDGVWYHIVCVFTASTRMEIFLDGVSEASSTTSIPASISDEAIEFRIGSTVVSSTTRYCDGLIDEVGIWSKALTSGEVTDLHNSGSGLAYFAPADIKNNSTLTTSLVSYWEMEETSGTRIDSHGVNDLTDNNTVLSATGITGNGADFEKTNSEYLSIVDGSQTGLDITSDISLSCWVKLESQPSDPDAYALAYKWSSLQQSYGFMYVLESSVYKLRFVCYTTCSGANISISKNLSAAFTLGTWYHVAIVFDAAGHPSGTGTVEYYVNGVSLGTTTDNSATGMSNCTGTFCIGALTNIQWFTDGLVDEVGIWSKVLSKSEVRALYGYGAPPNYEDVASSIVPSMATLGVGA